MFSALSIPLGKMRGDPVKFRMVGFGLDIITGLVLIILGSLSVKGTLPWNKIGGGFLIGLGCLELGLIFVVNVYEICLLFHCLLGRGYFQRKK